MPELPGRVCTFKTSLVRILKRFGRDRSGTVAICFGLLVIPLTAFVGLAVNERHATFSGGACRRLPTIKKERHIPLPQ
jgi:hypothetical protein